MFTKFQSAGRRFINPYRLRVLDHPGRVFNFVDPVADQAAIKDIAASRRAAGGSLVVEIGSGSGGHLIGLAARELNGSYFGFELRFKRAVRTIEKSTAAGIDRTYVLNIDGREFSEFFEPASVDAIYVNFPDPWEKKRQRKHRMLNAQFLDRAAVCLKPDGFISVKTDHAEYFCEFLPILQNDRRFEILESTEDLDNSPYFGGNIATEFELLFRSQGLAICYLKARLAVC